MERYDIAIVGTGPAGLSAAITAKIRNKSILLLGKKDLSDKVSKAHLIQNYLGLPSISGEDLAKAFMEQIEELDIPIVEEKVSAIYAMGEYFAIQTPKGQMEASTVILATGVNFGKALPGEETYLGRGVSYCATCDAMLYRGKKVAVLGYHKEAEEEAKFLAEVAEKVRYFPVYQDAPEMIEGLEVILEKPKEITGTLKADELHTEKGDYKVDGIFILRENISPAALVPGLEMDGNHIKVNLQMETNIKGCFACGDIVGTPYQYIKSAGQGNVAALSAVTYLGKKEKH